MSMIVNPPAGELERTGRVPLYLQIAQLLRQDIMSGRLRTGDPLPGDNQLVVRYGISSRTARSAVAVLREEGLILTRRGAGSYVASVPPPVLVQCGPGDVVSSRMPTPAERRALGIAEGVPVLSVIRPGREEELFDAGRARVTMDG